MFGIRRARLDVTRKAWAALAIITMAEGFVNLIGCGFIVCHWRADLLFSEWMDGQELRRRQDRTTTDKPRNPAEDASSARI